MTKLGQALIAAASGADTRPLIIALDLATVCGYARGRVGSTPSSGSIRLGSLLLALRCDELRCDAEWRVALRRAAERRDA